MQGKLAYIRFVQAFNGFFDRNKIDRMSSAPVKCPECDVALECSACPECGKDGGEIANEPYFSWKSCGCCGSSLGGNREDYVCFNANVGDGPDIEFEVSICEDCVYWNEYGAWPDMPMMDVDKDVVTVKLKDGRTVKLDGAAYNGTIGSSENGGPVNIEDVDLDATGELAA